MLKKLNQLLNEQSECTAFYHQGKPISCAHFSSLVKTYTQIATGMPSDEVILYCDNAFHFYIGFFAILAAGKIPILPAYLHSSISSEIGCIAMLTDRREYADSAVIITPEQAIEPSIEINISANAQIYFYTSGSTGTSKKVLKRFENMIDEVSWLTTLLDDALQKMPIFVATVNVHHMYGIFYHFLVPFCNRAIIDTAMIKTPEQLAEKLTKYSAVFLSSSPAFLSRLARNKTLYSFAKSTTAIVTAGGALDKSAAEACEELLAVHPLEIYGSTETGGIAWKYKSEIWTLYDSVRAYASTKDRLVILEGFIDSEFELADIVKFVQDGRHFLLKGRGDRLVKFEEKRVSLPELEQIIKSSELVCSAYVTYVGFLGACITLNDTGKKFIMTHGKVAIVDKLKKLLLAKIDPVCIPSKWRFLEELPLNAQGKIIHSKIEAIFANNIAEPVVLNKHILDDSLDITLSFLADAIYFKGHFPKLPLLAGVVQLHFVVHWIQQYLYPDLSVAGVKNMKFVQMIFPGDIVRLSIKHTNKGFEYCYYKESELCSSGIIKNV